MIQFSRPRKSYRKDDKFRQGLAHQIDAREAFAKAPMANDSKFIYTSIKKKRKKLLGEYNINLIICKQYNKKKLLARRGNRAYGQDFMQTHDPVGYIPSELGSLPSSQFSIPFIPSASGPFTQDLSQSSVFNRKNVKHGNDNSTPSGSRYVPGSSTFAGHALGWSGPGSSSGPGGMGPSQNFYSSQTSIGLALSQSDRLRMMTELASQGGTTTPISSNNNHHNLMSQDTVGYHYDDYKSQDISTMLSQDFDLRSQASQAYTQY